MKRKHYTEEYKQQVLEKYATSNMQMKELLAEEGIPKSTFTQWLRQYDDFNPDDIYSFNHRNFRNLIKRNQHLESVIAVLQESYCTARAPLRERLMEAENLYTKFNIHIVCDALNIPRGTFYNHIKRGKREHAWYFLRRDDLKRQIDKIFNDTKQLYGVRRMTAALKAQGAVVSQRLVRDLMREMGLINVRQYSKYVYEKEVAHKKNYVQQDFETDAPNKI